MVSGRSNKLNTKLDILPGGIDISPRLIHNISPFKTYSGLTLDPGAHGHNSVGVYGIHLFFEPNTNPREVWLMKTVTESSFPLPSRR